MLKQNSKLSILCCTILCSTVLSSCSAAYQRESAGQYIDSAAITTKVKANILADKSLRGLPITVSTYKSTVQLSGFVNTRYQRLRAEEIARNVQGVQSVQDGISIKSR